MKRAATYRRGWNAALRQMRATVHFLTPEWQPAGPLIAGLCRELRIPKPRGGTNTELARKYGASVRAIVYWRKAGCPFELGKPAVLKWLATRRSVPLRTEKQFGKRLGFLRFDHLMAGVRANLREMRSLRRMYRRRRMAVPDWLQGV